MAINAYTGLMGSGKSYEVVSSVIVPAIQTGRRVVTNIDGINPQAIYDYCLAHTKLNRESLGEVVYVTTEDVTKPFFFPHEDHPDVESVVRSGDLVAIDECWKFWSSDDKISDEHMTFFRMHRHFTHPDTGVTCDVALMIQDLGTLHRKLRAVVEMSTRTVKLKALGFNKSYRIELYEGNKLTKKTHLDTYNKRYNPEIFPLYKSYAAGEGKEKAMDSRQNVLMNKRLWIISILVVVLGFVALWYTWRFFTGKTQPNSSTPQIAPNNAATGATSPPNLAAGSTPPAAVIAAQKGFSSDWRLAGHFQANGNVWAVVANPQGRLRVESPSVFMNSGYAAIGEVDGSKVTVWTGAANTGLQAAPTLSPLPR